MSVPTSLLVTLLLAPLLGCTTYLEATAPDITPEGSIDREVEVQISADDQLMTSSVQLGLVHAFMPYEVGVGATLSHFVEAYLNQLFTVIHVEDNPPPGLPLLIFEIERFQISDLTQVARFDLRMTLMDGNGNLLLNKAYNGVGSGHSPFYDGVRDQEDQLAVTTQEAFQQVFEEMWADLLASPLTSTKSPDPLPATP